MTAGQAPAVREGLTRKVARHHPVLVAGRRDLLQARLWRAWAWQGRGQGLDRPALRCLGLDSLVLSGRSCSQPTPHAVLPSCSPSPLCPSQPVERSFSHWAFWARHCGQQHCSQGSCRSSSSADLEVLRVEALREAVLGVQPQRMREVYGPHKRHVHPRH